MAEIDVAGERRADEDARRSLVALLMSPGPGRTGSGRTSGSSGPDGGPGLGDRQPSRSSGTSSIPVGADVDDVDRCRPARRALELVDDRASVPGSPTISHSSGPSHSTSRVPHVATVFAAGASNGSASGSARRSTCARSSGSTVMADALGVVERGRHDLRGGRAAGLARTPSGRAARATLDERERDLAVDVGLRYDDVTWPSSASRPSLSPRRVHPRAGTTPAGGRRVASGRRGPCPRRRSASRKSLSSFRTMQPIPRSPGVTVPSVSCPTVAADPFSARSTCIALVPYGVIRAARRPAAWPPRARAAAGVDEDLVGELAREAHARDQGEDAATAPS